MAAIKPVAEASPGDRGRAGWDYLDQYWVRRYSCSGRFSIGLSSNNGLPGTPDRQLLVVEPIHAARIHSCRV